MTEFDAKQEARKIEGLAKDALQGNPGDDKAERALVQEVLQLQKDQAHLAAVKDQVSLDRQESKTLPSISFVSNADGTVGALIIERAPFDINGLVGTTIEKIDLNSKVAVRSKKKVVSAERVSGSCLPKVTFEDQTILEVELLNLLEPKSNLQNTQAQKVPETPQKIPEPSKR
ncbi:MAG: hypothetical protein HY711_08305 [Candidatus Melainabacteria bacterium]|nr:hypothetical protein [Candidatus Melainabacteria bacterium]